MEHWNTIAVFFLDVLFLADLVTGNYDRTFIPSDLNQTVDVDVLFSPSAIMFESCCSPYSCPARNLHLHKQGSALVKACDVRTGVTPTITLEKLKDNTNNFNDTLFAIVCVDPDVPYPTLAKPNHPYLHWMVVNIPNGETINGTTIRTYIGPAPPDNKAHFYYFLLYEQTSLVDAGEMRNYTNPVDTRSLFNISGFVMENNLKLVGVTFMTATTDEYVRYDYITLQSRDPAEFCTGVAGFKKPCITSGATFLLNNYVLVFHLSVLLNINIVLS